METTGDPLTELQGAIVQMHELFLSMLSAGFTEAQAIRLLADLFRPQPKDNE